MPARLLLTMDDLSRVVTHGLRERGCRAECRSDGDALLIDLFGISLSEWLPRFNVPVRVTWTLDVAAQRLQVEGRVRLGGLTSLLLVPGQHLGGGRLAIDALIAAVGMRAAVVARDNTGVEIDLARAPGGDAWRLRGLELVDGAQRGLVGSFQLR